MNQYEDLYKAITQKDLYIDSLLAEREWLVQEKMSAVEKLGTFKTNYRNLECTHFPLLQIKAGKK